QTPRISMPRVARMTRTGSVRLGKLSRNCLTPIIGRFLVGVGILCLLPRRRLRDIDELALRVVVAVVELELAEVGEYSPAVLQTHERLRRGLVPEHVRGSL